MRAKTLAEEIQRGQRHKQRGETTRTKNITTVKTTWTKTLAEERHLGQET